MFQYTPDIAKDWKNALSAASKMDGHVLKRVLDSMNDSQLVSKAWMVEQISHTNIKARRIALLGGWFATYTLQVLHDHMIFDYVENYEIDMGIKNISYKLNNRFYKNDTYKYNKRNVSFEPINNGFDLVINTSCEHMIPVSSWRKLNPNFTGDLVLQSSNMEAPDHINCVNSVEELAEQAMIMNVYYMGEKELPNGSKRFMVIGK